MRASHAPTVFNSSCFFGSKERRRRFAFQVTAATGTRDLSWPPAVSSSGGSGREGPPVAAALRPGCLALVQDPGRRAGDGASESGVLWVGSLALLQVVFEKGNETTLWRYTHRFGRLQKPEW